MTRVVDASGLEAAAELLRDARRILITAHVNPDADAIGSVLGLARGLRDLGKDAVAALSDPVPSYAQFLPGSETIVSEIPPGPFDVFVFADSADIERTGSLYLSDPARFQTAPILNIDHHGTNPLYGSVNYVIPGGSSTSELVYNLLCALGVSLDAGTATALLFGIVGDTGSFQNGATTPSSLEAASALIGAGAANQKVAFQLFESKTFAGTKLWGEILTNIALDRQRRIVFGYLSQEMLLKSGAEMDETEGVAEYLRGIREAVVVMLLKEQPGGEIRVSMRSRPEVDVAAIASYLGGGGHRQAAGCTVEGPVSAARKTLTDAYDRIVGT
ncbi:MAG TPA: bifunctional oligoribonuclease/PAP phosphatase NrnA [Chloroflexota bacterium]|nr:bifunctional oligoribonuclease/PAP phosphatase NrnA [Chloroflexota bacterium]